MDNVLFLGGAGFIGSSIINLKPNSLCCNIHVLEPDNADVSRIVDEKVILHRGKLSDIGEIYNIIKQNRISIIVHLVSTLIPGSGYEDYKNEYNNIIFPSIELMEICAKESIKFIYFSSGGTIYGNRNISLPFEETDLLAPISYYGWSKQMLENSILFKNRTAGLRYLILRPSNPYGHGQNLYGKQGIVAVAIGKILKGEPVEIWGDGSAVRDYIYIDDLAAIFWQLYQKDVTNIALNIGSGRGYSVNDVMAFLRIVTKEDIRVIYKNPRPVDVSSVILNVSKMKQLTSVNLLPFMDGIERFYNDLIYLYKKKG